MRIRVSSPGNHLTSTELDGIERDLEKIDRRLRDFADVVAEVRINETDSENVAHVVLELHYGPNHLLAKADHEDRGQAIRTAREEVLRQINARSRGGHSSKAKNGR